MKRTRSSIRGVDCALVLATLLFGGCGGGDDADASAGNDSSAGPVADQEFDPCALVTPGEAAEALGVAAAEADRPSEANTETRSQSYSDDDEIVIRLRTCRYTGELGQAVAVLTVMVRESSSTAESEIGFEGMRETYAESWGVTDVPGLGEQAYWLEEEPRGLHVLAGGRQLSISGDIDAGKARDLAAMALERME